MREVQAYDKSNNTLSFKTQADSVLFSDNTTLIEKIAELQKQISNLQNAVGTTEIMYAITARSINTIALVKTISSDSWKVDAPDVTQDYPMLWKRTKQSGNYTYEICGCLGETGADGGGVEWIYYKAALSSGETEDIKTSKLASYLATDSTSSSFQNEGHVPSGWLDEEPSTPTDSSLIWSAIRYYKNNKWQAWRNVHIIGRKSAEGQASNNLYAVTDSIEESKWNSDCETLKNNITLSATEDASNVNIPSNISLNYQWKDSVSNGESNKIIFQTTAYFLNSKCIKLTYPIRITGNSGTSGTTEYAFYTKEDNEIDLSVEANQFVCDEKPFTSNNGWYASAGDNPISKKLPYQFSRFRCGKYTSDTNWYWEYNGKKYGKSSDSDVLDFDENIDSLSTWNYGWSDPALISTWGQDGIDGMGVEYVFTTISEDINKFVTTYGWPEAVDNTVTTPVSILNPDIQTGDRYIEDNYQINWTDNPIGATLEKPYEYCWLRRTEYDKETDITSGTWDPSNIALWAHYGKNVTTLFQLSNDRGSYEYNFKNKSVTVTSGTVQIRYSTDGTLYPCDEILVGDISIKEDYKGNYKGVDYTLTKLEDYWELNITGITLESFISYIEIPIQAKIGEVEVGIAIYTLYAVQDSNNDGVYSYTINVSKSNVKNTTSNEPITCTIARQCLIQGTAYNDSVGVYIQVTDPQGNTLGNSTLTNVSCTFNANITYKNAEAVIRKHSGVILKLYAQDPDYEKFGEGQESYYYTGISTMITYTDPSGYYTSGKFIVDTSNCTAGFSYTDNIGGYYRVTFNNSLSSEPSFCYLSNKVEAGNSLSINFTSEQALGGATTSPNTTLLGPYSENNTNLSVSKIAWLHCPSVTVEVYEDSSRSNLITTTDIVRSGMEGYYWKQDDLGIISMYSTGTAMSTLTQTVENIQSTVSAYDSSISSLNQTATSISTKVESVEGTVSTLSTKIGEIEAKVENSQTGESSSLVLSDDSIVATVNGVTKSSSLILTENGGKFTGNVEASSFQVNKANSSTSLDLENGVMWLTTKKIAIDSVNNKLNGDVSISGLSSDLGDDDPIFLVKSSDGNSFFVLNPLRLGETTTNVSNLYTLSFSNNKAVATALSANNAWYRGSSGKYYSDTTGSKLLTGNAFYKRQEGYGIYVTDGKYLLVPNITIYEDIEMKNGVRVNSNAPEYVIIGPKYDIKTTTADSCTTTSTSDLYFWKDSGTITPSTTSTYIISHSNTWVNLSSQSVSLVLGESSPNGYTTLTKGSTDQDIPTSQNVYIVDVSSSEVDMSIIQYTITKITPTTIF